MIDRTYSRDREAARLWAQTVLARTDWAVLDTETTGLDSSAEVVQIAIVGPGGKTVVNTLVRPTRSIPRDATAIHGITDAMVADAPSFCDVHTRLLEILRGRTVIAYNAAFDRRILRQTALLYALREFPVTWECAMEQYARYVGQRSSRRGGYVWQPLPRRPEYRGRNHQAIDDCLATLELIQRMAHVG